MRLLILLIVAGAGCAAPPPAPPSAVGGSAAGDSLAGTLRIVGSAPVNVRLVLQGPQGSTTVRGPVTEELRRLGGAEVTLFGTRDGGDFAATDYRVRSIDGQPATLGTVESRDGEYLRLRTAGGEMIYLVAPPEDLRPGQKVWVQGPRGVIVQSFGTVRP